MPPSTTTSILAVKSKEGELEAVLHEPTTHIQLMVELLPGVTPESRVGSKVIAAGLEAVSDGNPLWLDTTWLPSTQSGSALPATLTDFDSTLDDVIQEMVPGYDEPVLIPVITADADHQQLRALRHFLEHKRRPVVVRARPGRLVHGRPWLQIERIAQALRLAVDELHLVVDEGYVLEVSSRRVHELSATVTELIRRHEYSSLAVLAGSTPPSRDTEETHTRERSEVRLWKSLQAECGYLLRYGDYGVVHPEPPPKKTGSLPQPNPYLHYTVPEGTLTLMRRVPDRVGRHVPSGALDHVFREVADELVHRPEFAGVRFSWGDRRLHSCRTDPTIPVGKSSKWIALATSHHLAHLANEADAGSSQLLAS